MKVTPLIRFFVTPIFLSVLLFGCANQQKKTDIKTPDNFINSELAKAIAQNEAFKAVEQTVVENRFDVVAKNSDKREFLKRLVQQTGLNAVIDNSISGKISINLQHVSLTQALEAIRDQHGIHFEKTSYGYQFFGNGEQTRIFQVDYPSLSRSGDSGIQVKGHGLTGGSASAITTKYDSDFWKDLTQALESLVPSDDTNKVVVNKQSGLVVITTTAKKMSRVQRFLRAQQTHMIRQVVIEAKVLEVRLNERFNSGINWQALTEQTGKYGIDAGFSGSQVTPASGLNGVFGMSLSLENPLAVIELLGSQGDVQVLSSPRISTINNQKAVIKVGADDYYVKGVSPEKDEDGKVSDISVEFESIFSGIALDVTPKITESGEIILHVRPTITEVSEVEKVITYGELVYRLPMASSKVRETDSIIRAKNHQIIVIGGLLQSLENEQDAGVPMISKLPGLGSFFNQKQIESTKSELVILLQPSIISADVWAEQLDQSFQRIQPIE
jgi:MSHA biogenesis protein MshL